MIIMSIFQRKQTDVSIIVTISESTSELENIYQEFSQKLENMDKSCEFVLVQYTDYPGLWDILQGLHKKYANVKVIKLRSVFSESVALSAGFEKAEGKYILTLPMYFQIDLDDIDKILLPLEDKFDLVTAWRHPRKDALLNRIESWVFNWFVSKMTGIEVHDLGCGVTGMTKEVTSSVDIYGDLFRFIPILVHRQGYRVGEVKIRHVKRLKKSGLYGIGLYVRRLLDILTLFFLVKFTKKPLRFFGLIGSGFFGLGFIIGLYLTIYKLLGNAIGNRPLLILGVLLMVLGIQLLSIGLIGEVIIFTHAKKVKEYNIEKILE